MKELAEKWVKTYINTDELKGKIEKRLERKEYGYNKDKTVLGMFVQDIITDFHTRFTNVELACQYGLITEEKKQELYDKDDYSIDYSALFVEVEREISSILKEKTGLKGCFDLAWAEPWNDNTDNYYGICYREAV